MTNDSNADRDTVDVSAASACYAEFPPHNCGLYLEHNPNRDYSQSVAEWVAENNDRELFVWKDDASRDRAIETNELWTLQWYPFTSIGFNAVAAPTLQDLLKWASEYKA
jgi:hypothetical protein